MAPLGTLEIHIYSTKGDYLGRYHPNYVKTDFYDQIRAETDEAGFCGFPGEQQLDALGLPHGYPNIMTYTQMVCHLIPTTHSRETSLPAGTQLYVFKAVPTSQA